MNRRPFLQSFPLLAPGLALAKSPSSTSAAAPIRTLYSNDTTHILSCKSPWREWRADFTDGDLVHSIREAAGADAHFLQPGLGWIPWWKSEIYSIQDHFVDFLEKEYGRRGLRKIDRYLLYGGDLLDVLVKTCAEAGVAPFLSYRLNDGHHVRELPEALDQGVPSPNMARHFWENYSRFRIGPDPTDWAQGVFNWAIPEVRDYKFSLIAEACANYDLAGLELDFVRHWSRFASETTQEERAEITTNFVGRVRKMLDRTAKERGLPHRWLCIRVPARANVRPEQGVDLAALARVGVDMVNLSWSYFTVQDNSVLHAIEEIGDPRVAVYAEMTHCTMTGKATAGSGTQPFLRTTDEQFTTTTRLARDQGAQGVSLFNFPYYRYNVTDPIGPVHAPPFPIISKLKDDAFLADQSQWYFLTAGRNDPLLEGHPLPVIVNRNPPASFTLQMVPTPRHQHDGIFRLRSDEDISDRVLEVRFNDTVLQETDFVEKPLPHPYDNTWLGKPSELRCFALPAGLAQSGSKRIDIALKKGIRVRLRYLDATLPIA